MNVVLKRVSQTDEETFGVIIVDDNPICFTLELPWKDNEENVSCIPEGVYNLNTIGATADIPYEHYVINDVPDRTNVRLHAGNHPSDSMGCIICGRQVGPGCVALSRVALSDLISALPKSFPLKIQNVIL